MSIWRISSGTSSGTSTWNEITVHHNIPLRTSKDVLVLGREKLEGLKGMLVVRVERPHVLLVHLANRLMQQLGHSPRDGVHVLTLLVFVAALLLFNRSNVLLGEVDIAALGVDAEHLQHLPLADTNMLAISYIKLHKNSKIRYTKNGAHAFARNLRERQEALQLIVLEERAHDAHVIN